MRALDLFCGAGLSSAGAQAGGATLVGAVDLCPIATATYAANFPDARVVNSSLEDLEPSALRRKIGDVDLLIASPECTNHTCAKGSAPRSEDSRATALQVVRYAKTFRPRWIVMENVLYMRPWSRYPELVQELQCLGYFVREHVLDATQFGVPQKRRRLFVVCGLEGEPPDLKPRSQSRPSVRDILDPDSEWEMTPLFRKGRASDTRARARRAISELGDGKPFLIVYYGTDGCGGWQRLDRPLRTVTTVDRFALVRPSKNGHMMRMLQVSELRRAMGLRTDFKFPNGTRRDKIRMLGNGVCPPVMRAVVQGLRTAR